MPKSRVRVALGEFTGGLNEDDAPNALAANDLRVARNVYWEGRALATRRGATRVTNPAVATALGRGLFQFEWAAGANRNLIAFFDDISGGVLYGNCTSATPTQITGWTNLGGTSPVTFTMFNDVVIFCDDGASVSPGQWTGSGGATQWVPAIAPSTMLAKWNRLFASGFMNSSPLYRTIRYSALGDHTSMPAANTVAAILGDATSAIEGRDFIWQLGHLGDAMFVGLQNSIGRVLYTGDTTTPFRYNQLAEFGIEGQKNYVSVGNGGYFLSKYGVHFIRSTDIGITYETSMISGRRLRTTWANLNLARLRNTYGTFIQTARGNSVVLWPLTSAGGTTHDLVLLMDVTDGPGTERFAVWTGWTVGAMASVVNTSTRQPELWFTNNAGRVWQGDTGTNDNGAAYSTEAATRWEDFGEPAEKKNFRDLYVEARATSGNLNIDVLFDYRTTSTPLTMNLVGAGQDTWGNFVWGTGVWAGFGIVRDNLLGVDDGHVMSFRFYNSSADQPWALYKVVPAVESVGEAIEAA